MMTSLLQTQTETLSNKQAVIPISDLKFANIMDEIHDNLDQRVFSGIDPRPNKVAFIRRHFYDGMRDTVANPEDYLDLFLTGSLTTYQYSDNSDCDISVFPNYDKLPELMGLPDANAVRKALIKVVIDKLDGVIVPGTSHPIQHFVVLVGNEPEDLYKPGERSAWSFQTESWFVPPEKDRVHNVKQELPAIYLRAHAIADKMRVALDTDPKAAIRLFQRIHIKRTQDQRAGRGDFSEGNVVYKYLLHEGLFDRLRQIGVYIAKTAGSPDAGFEDWTCPKCGASGRDNVYEDPEGGFECRKCGMAIVSKVAADSDTVQIIYDFIKDRIILGTKAEAAKIPNTVVVGFYRDGIATINQVAHQWLNTAYFKKLWLHSFPTWPLKGIMLNGPQGPEKVGTAPKSVDQRVKYIQAFVFFDKPINGLLTEPGASEHSELIEAWVDTVIDNSSGYHPADAEQEAWKLINQSPKTAGHVGEYETVGGELQPVAVFYSDFMRGTLSDSLKLKALQALRNHWPTIIEGPAWVYGTRWYQGD